jgi:transcriptional regulator with XRE-family HTH domain
MAKRADATDTYVGERIKALRTAAGLSQTELGNRIGVTFQQVQKYEKGGNRVAAGRLAQIADLLDAKITDFFPQDGAINNEDVKLASANPFHMMSQSPRGVRLARAFNMLGGDKQDVVLIVAVALLETQEAQAEATRER